MAEKTRICFVCLGNIVRSPLAENLFIHLAGEVGAAGKYEVDSAGTGAWHVGESPDPRMRRVAARNGLNYDGSARQIHPTDLDRFDLILAMDHENLAALKALARTPEQRTKIHLLREFDPEGGPNADVPDPYYGDQGGFERVYTVIERSVRGLLAALEKDRTAVLGRSEP